MWQGATAALVAAALFGLSAPLSKLLLGHIGPQLLAGLLYLGAGLGLSLVRLVRRSTEAPLQRRDLPLLLAIILSGGVAGPLLLMLGLARLSAVAGALLLNLEAPFTMLLAVAFGEHLGRRAALAGVVVVTASLLLTLQPGDVGGQWQGALFVASACLAWGLDNNLTQRLSLRDPVVIVQWKTLGAGLFAVPLALAMGASVPFDRSLPAALLLGFGCYGVSIVLDVWALRLLGAAREAPLFATAPFVGALLAIPLLHERPRLLDVAAALMMMAGVYLILRERHGHPHTHEPIEHDHLHSHDDPHHHHTHEVMPEGPHAHSHRHERLTHEHPHTPDLHHRHKH